MTEIKRIGILSLAKIIGLIYTVIGIILWLFFGCFLLIRIIAQPTETPAEILWILCIVILLPFFYGVMGFIGGAFIAAIYNVVAGKIGGIEIELVSAVEPAIVMNGEDPL